MSKLITDSETLMWLLDPGVAENDSNLYYKAQALKDAASACSLRRTELKLNAVDEETQSVLDDTVGTLIDTFQVLSRLLKEFEDLLNPKEKGKK